MSETGEQDVYTLLLKGPGLTIERPVAPDVARAIVNLVMGGAVQRQNEATQSSETSELSKAGSKGQQNNRVSLREFMDESQATRNPDKIVTIGEYLARFEAADVFSRDDVKSRFKSAGESAPANFPRDFNWTIKNGWIAEDPKSSGDFYVTQKGRTAIDGQFGGEIKKSTAKPRRKPRKATGDQRQDTE